MASFFMPSNLYLVCYILLLSSSLVLVQIQMASASSSLCAPQSLLFISSLYSQCPPHFFPQSSPTQVDGESLDKALDSMERNAYISVLFYASWCPFSRNALYNFNEISSMFPEIKHLLVEESTVLPIVFSKYGVHSLPSILIMNQTSSVRYYGSKGLSSLVEFYKETTGYEPVKYLYLNQRSSLRSQKPPLPWKGSPTEILRREPYLVLSLLFLCLKAFLYFLPQLLSRLKEFWVSYGWHLNLGIFGETRQLLGRLLNVVNLKRIWCKLRLSKVRNFHSGAGNARVWASSLASVSLGKSSSTRSE